MQESSEKSRGFQKNSSLPKEKQSGRNLKKAAAKSSSSSQDDDSADEGSVEGSGRRKITHSLVFPNQSKEESSSEDEPIIDIVKNQKARPSSSGSNSKKRKSKSKKSSSESGSESSSSDQPLAKKIKAKASSKPIKKTADKKSIAVKKEKRSDGNTPTKSKPIKPAKSPKVKSEADGEDGEVEEDYKWWEAGDLSNGLKWTSLQHQGPLFPPPYEPHGVKMKYDGKPVTLTPAAEEVASFFAALVGTDHANNPTFCKNFFIDFLKVIKDEKEVYCGINLR
jgi:DNA topoisomerase I